MYFLIHFNMIFILFKKVIDISTNFQCIYYLNNIKKNGHVVNTSILFWNRNSNFTYLIQSSQTIMLIILHNLIIHIHEWTLCHMNLFINHNTIPKWT